MKYNFSESVTPQTNQDWVNTEEKERIKILYKEIKKEEIYKDIKIIKAEKNGQVVLKIQYTIPTNNRGLYLLELEEKLKSNIDEGITIWCEPVGDKSKLRNLRGVKIKT